MEIHKHNLECRIPGGYWLISNLLLIGKYPAGENEQQTIHNLELLYSLGIVCFLDLTVEGEKTSSGYNLQSYSQFLKEGMTYKRIPIEDKKAPTFNDMMEILEFIDSATSQVRPVYLHCRGGKYRTGTVVGCYLANHGVAVGAEALKAEHTIRMKTHADNVTLTPQQRKLVEAWRPMKNKSNNASLADSKSRTVD